MTTQNHPVQKNFNEGSLLLVALLILAILIVSVLSFGIIVLQNLNQSISLDHGILSFYAAESGIEDTLYEIRTSETPIASLGAQPTTAFDNSASWTRDVSSQVLMFVRDIPENDFWEVLLFDANSSLTLPGNVADRLEISWIGSGSEWVEVSTVCWTTSGEVYRSDTDVYSASSNPATYSIPDVPGLGTPGLCRARVKALYDDLDDVTIQAYNDVGGQVNFQGWITAISTGSYGRNRNAIRAIFPQRAPLLGVFGYVLFTEESLLKY